MTNKFENVRSNLTQGYLNEQHVYTDDVLSSAPYELLLKYNAIESVNMFYEPLLGWYSVKCYFDKDFDTQSIVGYSGSVSPLDILMVHIVYDIKGRYSDK